MPITKSPSEPSERPILKIDFDLALYLLEFIKQKELNTIFIDGIEYQRSNVEEAFRNWVGRIANFLGV